MTDPDLVDFVMRIEPHDAGVYVLRSKRELTEKEREKFRRQWELALANAQSRACVILMDGSQVEFAAEMTPADLGLLEYYDTELKCVIHCLPPQPPASLGTRCHTCTSPHFCAAVNDCRNLTM